LRPIGTFAPLQTTYGQHFARASVLSDETR
jgi:hypothetical protein